MLSACASRSSFPYRQLLLLLTVFSLSLSIAVSAHAATYYVATTGSDSNSGTEAAPFRTIAHAVKQLNEGDTVYVKGGVYNETGIIQIRKSNVKLLNAPGESPTIHCAQNPRPYHGILIQNPTRMTHPGGGTAPLPLSNITVEGFEIRNCLTGFRLYNVIDSVIRRNWIHHGSASGILGNAKNILIDRNVINSNGHSSLDHGMYITGTNYVITNNLIYDHPGYGVQMAGYPWDMSQYGGGGRAFSGHAERPDPSYAGAAGWVIANNTFAYQKGSGIVIWMPAAANSTIVNNIFYQNSSKVNGINFVSPGSGSKGHKINNNLFSGLGSMIGSTGKEGVNYTQTGNITANPNFEGAGATLSGVPNFKLKAGSPAIDKVQNSLTPWDHAGGERPYGAASDIGAYEFGSPPNSGSPPPNPTGGDFPSGGPSAPVLLGPNGEVCYSGY